CAAADYRGRFARLAPGESCFGPRPCTEVRREPDRRVWSWSVSVLVALKKWVVLVVLAHGLLHHDGDLAHVWSLIAHSHQAVGIILAHEDVRRVGFRVEDAERAVARLCDGLGLFVG